MDDIANPESQSSAEVPDEAADQLHSSPEVPQSAADKLSGRVSQLEKVKESQKKASSGNYGDDEDQAKAVAAAKSTKKTSEHVVQVMGRDTDLQVVSGHFFMSRAKKISQEVKKDVMKATVWLAGLREAYQAWQAISRGGKNLSVIVFAVVAFWKI